MVLQQVQAWTTGQHVQHWQMEAKEFGGFEETDAKYNQDEIEKEAGLLKECSVGNEKKKRRKRRERRNGGMQPGMVDGRCLIKKTS